MMSDEMINGCLDRLGAKVRLYATGIHACLVVRHILLVMLCVVGMSMMSSVLPARLPDGILLHAMGPVMMMRQIRTPTSCASDF
jgi:hypothetical protein